MLLIVLGGTIMPDKEKERGILESIILAGIGAVAKSAESAGELLEELVKKGELTVEQGKALNEELKHDIKAKVSATTKKVQSSAVSGFVNNMHKLTPEELANIREKMAELDKTVECSDEATECSCDSEKSENAED